MMDPKLVAASAIALAVTLFAIFSMRPWARRIGLVDKPDARKRHQGRIPLVGGLCFFLGTLAGLTYLGYFDQFISSLMAGGALLVVAGALDDASDLSVRSRLAIQAGAVMLVIAASGIYVDELGLWGMRLGVLGIPFTIVAVIGLINAFNMLDGIDGLAASLAMTSIGAILLFDHAGWSSPGVLLLLQVLFAALIPYLCVNLGWPDGRKIFMGDAGSTLIGFLLAWSLVFLSHGQVERLAPVSVLWCVALPIMDTLAVMYRRVRAGGSPFKADRQHLHHLVLDAGFSPRAALVLIVAGSGLLLLLGYALRHAPTLLSAAAFIAVLAVHILWVPGWLRRMRLPLWLRTPALPPIAATGAAGPELALAAQDWELRAANEGDAGAPRPGQQTPESAENGLTLPLKALCVLSAPPDAIQIAPIARELARDDRFEPTVCVASTQEQDAEQVLRLFDLQADLTLEVVRPGEDPADITAAALGGMERVLSEVQPDVVLVPGDTSATVPAMLAARYHQVPVVCIDVGDGSAHPLSADPGRKVARSLAALHVAQSESAGRQLLAEGVPPERVLFTGNTAIDTLSAALGRIDDDPALARELARRHAYLRAASPMLLALTREPPAGGFAQVARTLREVASRRPDLDIVCRSEVFAPHRESVGTAAAHPDNLHAVDDTDYLTSIYLLKSARMVYASDDLRAEAEALGIPFLSVENGNAGAVARILDLLDRNPHGKETALPDQDDSASSRVVEALTGLRPAYRHAETRGAGSTAPVQNVRQAS